MEKKTLNEKSYSLHQKTNLEQFENRKRLKKLFADRPIPDEHLLTNLGLYIRSSALAKILFWDEIYSLIRDIPGNIFLFGLWWGQDAILLENIRAIREPYNFSRKIVGFDTFEGYPEISNLDKESDVIKPGGYAVSEGYFDYLNELIDYHEKENIMGHIKKIQLVKGDARVSLDLLLEERKETIIAMAYFDMALYEPTKVCLEKILEHCIKGSIIVMDEINDSDYPGETQAIKEVLKLKELTIKRSQILPDRAYIIL